MERIPDDPMIACMEHTGYPQYMQEDFEDEEPEDDDTVCVCCGRPICTEGEIVCFYCKEKTEE